MYLPHLLHLPCAPTPQGCLAPITVRIPSGCILNPSDTAAVVGGNVLTSQRVTDVVLKAFQAAAASQVRGWGSGRERAVSCVSDEKRSGVRRAGGRRKHGRGDSGRSRRRQRRRCGGTGGKGAGAGGVLCQ